MMIYHLKCYKEKYRQEYRNPVVYCPPLLMNSTPCDYCQQEIKKAERPAREGH